MGQYNTHLLFARTMPVERDHVTHRNASCLGSKLRSLLARVLRRWGIKRRIAKPRRYRSKRQYNAFNGVQPLEGRQLLSVAIEMAVSSSTSGTYVYDAGTSTVNASAGDTFKLNLYVTSDLGSPYDTLDGYTLNFVGTDASLSLDSWTRNVTLFPDTDVNHDIQGFYDDAVNDLRVNGFTLFEAGDVPRTTDDMTSEGSITGWYLGSLQVTLPETFSDYLLTLSTTDADNPTRVTHDLSTPDISVPDINSLTFHIVDDPTVTIDQSLPTLTNDVAGNFSSIDITTANVDPTTFDIHDLKLELAGGSTISGTGWDAHSGVSLTNGSTEGTYQLVGLNDILDLSDGAYTLSVVADDVFNDAGVALLTDEVSNFTIDTAAPELNVSDVAPTANTQPDITGTAVDLTLDTMSITVSHHTDGTFASQTFMLANGDFTVDSNGNWTLAGSKLSPLEDGSYDVTISATDQLGQSTLDEVFQTKLTITDRFETNGAGDDDTYTNAVALTNSRQYNLSIHEGGDEDWKSLSYDGSGDLLFLANVTNGAEVSVELYFPDDGTKIGSTMTTTSGVLNESNGGLMDMTSQAAGTYYVKIYSPANGLVYDYNFVAGEADQLSNSVSGSVFVDENFNGTYNAADGDSTDLTVFNSGAGVTVELYDTANLTTPADTIVTTDGSYTFSNVISGTYRVRMVLPDGTFQTTAAPADITLDGAVDQTSVDFGLRDVEVAGRKLFYNNSYFDSSSDADAIATDKTALLPGQTATTANVSSYSRGINGIFVDVIGLSASSLDASDFQFHIGNDNTPDSWETATAPTSIDVLVGQGGNGSDRIALIWTDLAISKTWLQVQLLTTNTGLANSDVFYFGNALGDAMNSNDNLNVNATDQLLARANPASPLNRAAIDNLYDFNRDSLINATDQLLARANGTSPLNAVKYIDLSVTVAPVIAASLAADQVDTSSNLLAAALAYSSGSASLSLVNTTPTDTATPQNGVLQFLNN